MLISASAPQSTLPTLQPGWSTPSTSVQQVMATGHDAARFVGEYVDREAEFFDRARSSVTGLTFDGVDTDPATGMPTVTRAFSASSKESLDVGILTKALAGDPLAVRLVGRGDRAQATQRAVSILSKKIDTYEKFNKDFPGFGGMMPWVSSTGTVAPLSDWSHRTPGLDNGEWAWSLLTAEHVLRTTGETGLANRYRAYIDVLRESVVKMFFDPATSQIRAIAHINDPTSANSTYSTGRIADEVPLSESYLSGEHGVHEGQMMVLFATLFGKGLPEGAAQKIWDQIDFKRVEHEHGTTWEGFWGSPHESWAYMFLPLRDMPEYKELYRAREAIRSNYANDNGFPGLATSTNDPRGGAYLSSAGIDGISTQPVNHNDTFAIYGAYPMLLEASDRGTMAAGNAGLGWLVNMLNAPKQYGPMGGGESGMNDGSATAHTKTIDGSFPNLLSMMGGVTQETSDMLRTWGLYGAFTDRMKSEYQEAFGGAPLRTPSAIVGPKLLLTST